MNIERFQSHRDHFPVSEWIAMYEFKTVSSISFLLGEKPAEHEQSSAWSCKLRGRLEIHYPCEGLYKARLRIWLPISSQPTLETFNDITQAIFTALDIPSDETHQATFLETGNRVFHIFNFEVRYGGKEFSYISEDND